MTEEEKLIKHIDMMIDTCNEVYKEYRNTVAIDNNKKKCLCRVLVGGAFEIAKDFNELGKILSEVAE